MRATLGLLSRLLRGASLLTLRAWIVRAALRLLAAFASYLARPIWIIREVSRSAPLVCIATLILVTHLIAPDH
jgi:hypothetical protein